MKLVTHHSFDARQQALTVAILEAVAAELKKAEAPRDLIEQLTGAISFAVTSLLDDSASVAFEDGEISPMLTFQVENEELAYAGGNTWMHEYVHRLLPSVLHRLGDTGDA